MSKSRVSCLRLPITVLLGGVLEGLDLGDLGLQLLRRALGLLVGNCKLIGHYLALFCRMLI